MWTTWTTQSMCRQVLTITGMFLFVTTPSSSPVNTSDTSLHLNLDSPSFAYPKPAPLPCCSDGITMQSLNCLNQESRYHLWADLAPVPTPPYGFHLLNPLHFHGHGHCFSSGHYKGKRLLSRVCGLFFFYSKSLLTRMDFLNFSLIMTLPMAYRVIKTLLIVSSSHTPSF